LPFSAIKRTEGGVRGEHPDHAMEAIYVAFTRAGVVFTRWRSDQPGVRLR
jgi:hypothetical protein